MVFLQRAGVAELADARDSKSRDLHWSCGFDPHLQHHSPSITYKSNRESAQEVRTPVLELLNVEAVPAAHKEMNQKLFSTRPQAQQLQVHGLRGGQVRQDLAITLKKALEREAGKKLDE